MSTRPDNHFTSRGETDELATSVDTFAVKRVRLNVGGIESIGAVISRCCELLFVLQTALERDGFLHGNSENSNSNSRVVYGQGTCEAALQQYDFVAETFAIAVKKRFVKAFANTQHSRAPELMLNCCAKQIEFLPSLVATTLIQFNNEKNGNDNTASFLEELFEKRSSAFASTIASAMSDSARVYC